MKKRHIILSFLCGMVIPVMAMAIAGHRAEPAETEPTQQQLTDTAATEQLEQILEESPSEIRISVLKQSGETQSMELDEYLLGVVLSEMPASFHEEALKAQAVVARTYALKRLYNGGKHESAAVCTTSSCCQGYVLPEEYIAQGGSAESLERVRGAVEATSGLVLTYAGKLIDATYFASSGGSTESAVEVWGQDVPYLQATDSPEEESAIYAQTVSFAADEFCQRLGIEGTGDAAGWIGDTSYTAGGGVEIMEICGTEFTGTQIREKLGLRSTVFTVVGMGDVLIVQTRGFGHRVGMSQYGAQAMAQEGSTYDAILIHYYKGTAITAIEQT